MSDLIDWSLEPPLSLEEEEELYDWRCDESGDIYLGSNDDN